MDHYSRYVGEIGESRCDVRYASTQEPAGLAIPPRLHTKHTRTRDVTKGSKTGSVYGAVVVIVVAGIAGPCNPDTKLR